MRGRIILCYEVGRLQRAEALVVKIFLSFLCGIIVCGLLLFGVQSVLPIRAQTSDGSDNLSSLSENLSQSLVSLLPDIEKIYREALTSPLQEAKKQIYDEDIAEFYNLLLDRSSLNNP